MLTQLSVLLNTQYVQGIKDYRLNQKNLTHFECYVDAGFAGNVTKETSEDSNSVQSRTVCVIKYSGFPIKWFSHLQK